MDASSPVGRLAPSPTGAQHVGNARTYLIAWLSARSRSGKVLLRIEDIDSPRVKPWAFQQTLEDLRWLGLDWDGEPLVQTERFRLYQGALEQLKARELVYPCTCTRGDIEVAASAPHPEHEGPVYPGTCSGRTVRNADDLGDLPFAWRFRTPDETIVFEDGYRGLTGINPNKVGGDFVVWKSSGTPAYQLAVVVDDALTGITEVIRGDDLLPSTPRQLLLYRAMNWQPPKFIHVPLVVGPDGRRLAKRHGDTRLSTLRESGVTAEALIGLLAWSCGWQADTSPLRARDLLPRFSLASIPVPPFCLSPEDVQTLIESSK